VDNEDVATIMPKVRSPAGYPGVNKLIHEFDLKALSSSNDPNLAGSEMSSSTDWSSLLK
jgi:hypothetical protein